MLGAVEGTWPRYSCMEPGLRSATSSPAFDDYRTIDALCSAAERKAGRILLAASQQMEGLVRFRQEPLLLEQVE
jgi:hypothetical protein